MPKAPPKKHFKNYNGKFICGTSNPKALCVDTLEEATCKTCQYAWEKRRKEVNFWLQQIAVVAVYTEEEVVELLRKKIREEVVEGVMGE